MSQGKARWFGQQAVTGLTQPRRTSGSVWQGADELQKLTAREASLCPPWQLEQGAPGVSKLEVSLLSCVCAYRGAAGAASPCTNAIYLAAT